ncbi:MULTISPECIES: arsinothricin resistance N-acetyltransferase ArsN1 family B [unclassified Haladaptatus]|uniref:arsinothricin resistance N-acetyltransferase ArsN1 family B n=1 Tax=unclassified Haladaptatus TaxID=2622732 RepID=UPI00209C0B12|nr:MULTISPECIES: arsinothricin resistance N-acetyltransferase ArsN1 family B [unclassified Haladaptatus]MCO8245891.1 GNAT family N-acetyltransferase [Haladaptatus sp. AB643]MCO8254489.1 GNAT family N-acetyltransferase [Haladaptatus sp. AB618]
MVDIRLVEPADAEAITDIYAPIVRETVISFERTPPDEAEIENRIEATLPTYPWLVCVLDDELLGYAYASPHRSRESYQWSVDVSVYVRSDHHRSGIGRGLYESLFALLREQGYYNAYAGIALPNPGSVGLHESLGFEQIGTYRDVGYKDGAWRSVGWWHLRISEKTDGDEAEPTPPRSLSALDGSVRDDAVGLGRGSIRLS